ncbi:hypothetical protein WMY93_030835 [Mugilogobius chulae]|uniref:Uncharacterized protein n=1 Tax=Mugilogobius chulae TaxID=88201 RepID=A0AAW0MIK5_9GOBI
MIIRLVSQTFKQAARSSSIQNSSIRFNLEDKVIYEVLTQDQILKMLLQLQALEKLRMDPHFRVQLYFSGDSGSTFVTEYRTRNVQMRQMLEEMETAATELDNMKMGEKISSVAGSVVGLAGGVTFITGLALSPLTGGVSALLVTGASLGGVAGANGLVTFAAKYFVNRKQKKRAQQAIKQFKDHMTAMQSCLDEATFRKSADLKAAIGVVKILGMLCEALEKSQPIAEENQALLMMQFYSEIHTPEDSEPSEDLYEDAELPEVPAVSHFTTESSPPQMTSATQGQSTEYAPCTCKCSVWRMSPALQLSEKDVKTCRSRAAWPQSFSAFGPGPRALELITDLFLSSLPGIGAL